MNRQTGRRYIAGGKSAAQGDAGGDIGPQAALSCLAPRRPFRQVVL